MMFSNDDDDDFATSTTSGSKLASLFDLDQNRDGNQSLTYNAPKQPKKQKTNAPDISENVLSGAQSSAMSVIHATAVEHCFKYENNKHVGQGKLGAAIIGNHPTKSYMLILYKGQQQHVAVAAINNNFFFIIQSNNYASFYDDHKMNWSLNFKDESSMTEFAKQICIAKANSCGKSLDSLICQNLIVGDGDCLDTDDSVEIRYTGWILSSNKLGEIVDSNATAEKALRVKIGRGKCIKGIDDALVGMKKHGRRLVVVPPSLGYANRKPKLSLLQNAIVVYEIEVKKVKFNKDDNSTRSSTPSVAEVDKDIPGRLHSPSNASDDSSIRARGASLSEQLSQSPDRKKATIISRIVKMGQPMIPLQGAIVAQPNSESENEEEISNVLGSPPSCLSNDILDQTKPVLKPRPQHVSSSFTSSTTCSTSSQLTSQTSTINTVPQPVSIYQPTIPYALGHQPSFAHMPGNQFALYSNPYSAPPIPSPVMLNNNDAQLPLLLTENRTQAIEIRLQIGKMADKLDQIMNKIDHPQISRNVGSMDAATLSFNIQKIIQENEKLRAEVAEKSSRVDNQNEKICELLHKNQKCMEQNNLYLEQRTNFVQSDARILTLEEEKKKVTTELNETVSRLKSVKTELQTAKEKIKEMETKNELLSQQKSTTDNVQNALKNAIEERDELQKKLKIEIELRREKEKEIEKLKENRSNSMSQDEVEKFKALECKLSCMKMDYENAIATLQSKTREKGAAGSGPGQEMFSSVIVPEVKRIMNSVYRQLQNQFDANTKYSGTTVCKSIKETVLAVTMKLIDRYDYCPPHSVPAITSKETDGNHAEAALTDGKECLRIDQPITNLEKIIESDLEIIDQALTEPKKSETSEKETSDSESPLMTIKACKPELPPAPRLREIEDDDDEDNEWLK